MIKVHQVSRRYIMLFMHNNKYLPLTGLLTLLQWTIHNTNTSWNCPEIFQKYFRAKKFTKFYITICNTSKNRLSLAVDRLSKSRTSTNAPIMSPGYANGNAGNLYTETTYRKLINDGWLRLLDRVSSFQLWISCCWCCVCQLPPSPVTNYFSSLHSLPTPILTVGVGMMFESVCLFVRMFVSMVVLDMQSRVGEFDSLPFQFHVTTNTQAIFWESWQNAILYTQKRVNASQ